MRTKQGVSLMVLILTIIVMVILAGTVIITLNNQGVINRAQGAVGEYNLRQVEELANVAWGEAFVAGNRTAEDLESYILKDLEQNGVKLKNYDIKVTTKGVTVAISDGRTATTLGVLVATAEDYGKTINYKANGVTDWKVFYKTTIDGEEYVYLIASERLTYAQTPKTVADAQIQITISSDGKDRVTFKDKVAGEVQRPNLWLAMYDDYTDKVDVSHFLNENNWTMFKNTEDYGDNVVGAIGAPTLEMFVASWNEKGEALNDTTKYIPLTITAEDYGVALNSAWSVDISSTDKLYMPDSIMSNNYATWFATPKEINYSVFISWRSRIDTENFEGNYQGVLGGDDYECYAGLRPVVCMKASTPVYEGTDKNIIIK